MIEAKDLYLDLMKKCLTYLIYGEVYLDRYDQAKPGELNLIHPQPSDLEMRTEGRDWPTLADTMIGLKRLDNLQFCVEDVLANNVPGDLIEAGVWRGGASIFMRAILSKPMVSRTSSYGWQIPSRACRLPTPISTLRTRAICTTLSIFSLLP